MTFVRETRESSAPVVVVELNGSDGTAEADESRLTLTEREIYELLYVGKSDSEIAQSRIVSPGTV
jgi:DNA-binding CsgD family transcriptional regulator